MAVEKRNIFLSNTKTSLPYAYPPVPIDNKYPERTNVKAHKDGVGIVKISTDNNQYRTFNRSIVDFDDFIRAETEIK